MSANSRAVIQRFIEEILNRKKLAVADEIVAEDFVELDPFPGQAQGRQGLKDVLGMFFSGFPDMNWLSRSRSPRATR
jgi:hypothetical protein